jgi:UDP-N-acetylglucosamine--N-acetylmuramyl-(pentapeptide) pyrophosphoryl-undecaprenol N-acetylglucosamine transferase
MSEQENILNQTSSVKNDGGFFIIAGGGTGGHIFPAIAIANAIKKIRPNAQFLFIGAKGKMEMDKVPQAGYHIEGIDIVGFNRSSLIKNIGLPYKIAKSFFQVASIFKSFKADAVIGVGGYSSFPVLRYAQRKNIPTFIHESNSFAGRTNILLGKKATAIFTASDGMEEFFPSSKIIITGNPVRQTISHSVISKEAAVPVFGLDATKKIVLVIGGSLGAKSINESIDANINFFAENNLQLIWQTGKPYFQKATETVKDLPDVHMKEFITQMEFAYAAADFIVSRSGAIAVAEICIVAKPAIFVPYPFAAEDHQTANAKSLVRKNAGILVKDSDAKNRLIPTLLNLTKDVALQNELKNNITKLAINNADEVIANEILKKLK